MTSANPSRGFSQQSQSAGRKADGRRSAGLSSRGEGQARVSGRCGSRGPEGSEPGRQTAAPGQRPAQPAGARGGRGADRGRRGGRGEAGGGPGGGAGGRPGPAACVPGAGLA